MITIGAEYLRIVSFSYLFAGLTQCYLTVMKISGFAKVSVWISALTVIIDMVADLFLIYGIDFFPSGGKGCGLFHDMRGGNRLYLVSYLVSPKRECALDEKQSPYRLKSGCAGFMEDCPRHPGQQPVVGIEHHGSFVHSGASGDGRYCRIVRYRRNTAVDRMSDAWTFCGRRHMC